MQTRFVRSLGALIPAAPCLAIALLAAGCGQSNLAASSGGGVGAPPPSTAPTPITQCIVDSDPDVVIGDSSTDAKSGCDNVVMDAATTLPAFDEIMIGHGGTLTIINSGGDESSAAATSRDAEQPKTIRMRQECIQDGGKMQYGTQNKPITSKDKVIIEFTGTRNSKAPNVCSDGFRKGIEVRKGGTLLLYGAKGVPARGGVSWTTLAAPAGSRVPGAKVASTGPKTLDLTADVTKGQEGWQKGDWIVVATTDYTPYESEFVQIASVTSGGASGGSTVTLAQPLKYYHFGSPPPSTGSSAACLDRLGNPGPASYCDGADRNYGVDERAEVGLISRDIELTAQTAPAPTTPPAPATSSVHWGGEIMIHPGFKEVAIQGVRLSKFGKDQLNSYPIHFHMVGTIGQSPNPEGQSALIDSDSVDHSYNKCVTIHDTSNLTISNMVCARIVGHIYYEQLGGSTEDNVADDDITFQNDLGIGAMSNNFDINPLILLHGTTETRQQLINQYWWAGDYMTNAECKADGTCIGYDGFNIPDTDDQTQLTHGGCFTYTLTPIGNLQLASAATPCGSGEIYDEPASGFWIQNPATNLVDDAIAGCQGVGEGFWWVTPPTPITVNGSKVNLLYQALGTVKNDRASGCYFGFSNDGSIGFVSSGSFTPHEQDVKDSPSIFATLDGITATHNRFRGAWFRPTWTVVKNGRFAVNRENVSLLSSGGIDGNPPGVWTLLEDSVIVGESQNNVERWGPCPDAIYLSTKPNPLPDPGNVGSEFGCIDYTPANFTPTGQPHSGDIFDNGYPSPKWNEEGYMLYDGPARVFHDRFVNFNYDEGTKDWNSKSSGSITYCTEAKQKNCQFSNELDDADRVSLVQYEKKNANPVSEPAPMPYEGDAAFGWFQSNMNSYPSGTATKQLSFVNTNLRHQVYTADVSLNPDFNDGDKNTSILDEDGTLSGLGVQLAPNSGSNTVYPISLNNLPFNGTSNSVDECLSRGGQNQYYEGRTSALMSPASMGTLQFSSLYPGSISDAAPNSHKQQVTFTRDDAVPNGNGGEFHPTMVMKTGRNGLGSYEPKVSNGYGYTVKVSVGLLSWIDVTLADVVDPNISTTHPFYIRLGINYTSKGGTHPQLASAPGTSSLFAIKRGYKSYVGGNVWQGDPELLKYWIPLNCTNLDAQNIANLPTQYGGLGYCPGGSLATLTAVDDVSKLMNADGTPNMHVYYYNQTTGYLYLNVVQSVANPIGPSPTGSCSSAYDGGKPDPACPDTAKGESYYACPKYGCVMYGIQLNDPTYVPDPSTGQPAAADAKVPPTNQNQLVVYGTNTIITRKMALDKQNVPYYTATNAPVCATTQPQ